jgi:hypothetical protein
MKEESLSKINSMLKMKDRSAKKNQYLKQNKIKIDPAVKNINVRKRLDDHLNHLQKLYESSAVNH